jgi:hypothetical protein
MKAYRRVDIYVDTYLLDLGTNLRWVVSFTPLVALPPRKEPPVYIVYEAEWVLEPVWTTWRQSFWPYRGSNSDSSVIQLVASRYTDYAIRPPQIGRVDSGFYFNIIIFFTTMFISLYPEVHYSKRSIQIRICSNFCASACLPVGGVIRLLVAYIR